MKTAFVFPGQGSQQVGMGKALWESSPQAREVFARADSALDMNLSGLCFQGPEEDLRLTANTQPAILTVSVAAFSALKHEGINPDVVAGHSLGEYSALVAAGSLNFEDAVTAVRKRGQFMQEAVPAGEGAMAALIGQSVEVVEDICREASELGVCSPANLNSPGQIVIAGNREAIERAVVLAKEAGAKRAILLQVSAPFHCSLLVPAEEQLAAEIDRCTVGDLRCPLVTNVDAAIIRTGAEARTALKRQVSRPVRWQDSIQRLLDEGVRTFVEVGPGRVLLGLIRSIDKSVTMLNAEDEKSVENVLSALL